MSTHLNFFVQQVVFVEEVESEEFTLAESIHEARTSEERVGIGKVVKVCSDPSDICGVPLLIAPAAQGVARLFLLPPGVLR